MTSKLSAYLAGPDRTQPIPGRKCPRWLIRDTRAHGPQRGDHRWKGGAQGVRCGKLIGSDARIRLLAEGGGLRHEEGLTPRSQPLFCVVANLWISYPSPTSTVVPSAASTEKA